VGKLKKALLVIVFRQEQIEEMRRVKRCFDPENPINPGNIF